jgi:cell wall assembly regulator SMI1
MPDPHSASSTWADLERELAARIDPNEIALRPPAAPEAIARTEAALGTSFSPDFAASLAVHEGQGTSGLELIGGFRLYDLSSIVGAWQMFLRMEQDGSIAWDRRWIPIATDGNGNHLILDLAPGPSYGRVAQVPRLVRAPTTVAADFASWLGAVARDTAGGVFDEAFATYAD